jgi:large subunit ribosomal protein L21
MVETPVPDGLGQCSSVSPSSFETTSSGRRKAVRFKEKPRMYAIVNINGSQTRVTPDETLVVPRLEGEPGQKLNFDQVLMVCDGDRVTIGQPYLEGASLTAEVLEHLRGPKLRVFKFKRRREYRRRIGHRDSVTRIRVTSIQA